MSSAVSLVPTKKASNKSRRPAFRPGGNRKGRNGAAKGKTTAVKKAGASKPSTSQQGRPAGVAASKGVSVIAEGTATATSVVNDRNDTTAAKQKPPGSPSEGTKTRIVPGRKTKTATKLAMSKKSIRKETTKSTKAKAVVAAKTKPSTKAPSSSTPRAIVPQPRKAVRKRKATTGITIGSTRQSQSQSQPLQTPRQSEQQDNGGSNSAERKGIAETTTGTTTAAAAAAAPTAPTIVIPPADPGAKSLKDFCTKFKTDGPKQNKKDFPPAVANPAPLLPPPPEETKEESAGPVVEIVNGEIVLQEASMIIPTARKTVAEVEQEYQQVVEEEGNTTAVGASYNSFANRRKPQHWSVDETKLFYRCLRQVGLDFGTMEAFFEKRTRKQLRKKYLSENTKNPHLIAMSLDPRAKIAIGESVVFGGFQHQSWCPAPFFCGVGFVPGFRATRH